tara:strand:- start:612 stop:818 length:207 start_codon:yes stop_codon:yes gene_type:complete
MKEDIPQITLQDQAPSIPTSNPTYMDARGIEYEIDRVTKAHRRLTPKTLSKKLRNKIRKGIARNATAK